MALHGKLMSDDHINLKTLQSDASGRVFAAVKTSLNDGNAPSTSAQIDLLVFKPATGSWTSTVFGTIADCHTRPLVLLDEANQVVHMFATAPTGSGCPYSGAPGTIYEKTAPMSNPVFPAGRGTPVIQDGTSAALNNATSTKQPVNASTGLVVLAGNDSTHRYWHMDEALPGPAAPTAPTASFTATPTSGVAPLGVSFTDTSTGQPTVWSWDFGDGTTSSAENPSDTYSQPGTFTVTLTASNSIGSSTATTTITVAAPTAINAASSTSAAQTTATSATVDLTTPAGTVAGDFLLAAFTVDNDTAVTGVPTGWSQVLPCIRKGGANICAYWHVATAGDAGATDWVWPIASAQRWGGGMTRFTGVNPTSPFAAPVTTANSGTNSVTSVSLPAATTSIANTMLVSGIGANGATSDMTPSAPWTRAWESVGGKMAALASLPQPAAGSGTVTWTLSAARTVGAWLTALQPAG